MRLVMVVVDMIMVVIWGEMMVTNGSSYGDPYCHTDRMVELCSGYAQEWSM